MPAHPRGRAGPLATLTIATNSLPPLRLFLETGHGLQCHGPVTVDATTRRARAGISDAACIRVLVLDRYSEPWRGNWEPAVYGPYTIGFPNTVQESLDARLRLLGFGARNPLERTLLHHPDGRSWEILESLATAPEFVAAVGIARGAGSPAISPVDAQGLGGPAYSMCVVKDTDRMAGFMRAALGFEIRNRRRQTSAGRLGAMNTPDGTQFDFAQSYPPYGAHGFMILLQFTNLAVAQPPRPPRPPRLPATGLVMYSFPVDDIEAVLRQTALRSNCFSLNIDLMLINNWYVAAYAHEVTATKPLGVRMLCCDFVLYRDPTGKAVCLSNVCVHRGAALANGQIVAGNVECPYHGWQYGNSGRCAKIPAMGDEAVIPKRARIDSYPTVEKYGWVWVFLGDLPEADRPQVPDLFPEYEMPDQWRLIHYQGKGNVNWARFEENSLDTAHINFVHPTFGTRRAPRVRVVPITPTEYGASVQRVRPAPKVEQKTGGMAKILNPDRGFTAVSVEFSLIGVCHRIQPVFQEGMSIITFSVKVPIDATNTRTFGMQARNFLLDPAADKDRHAMILKALNEDLAVVTRIEPKLPPRTAAEEFLTETDGMEFQFRQRVRDWARRGHEIDVEKMQSERLRRVLVIPSPQRRSDPGNWVHRTVPLVPPGDLEAPVADLARL